MVLRQHGYAWCLSGRLKRLAYSRIDLSLLQRQSTSQEKHGRLRHFELRTRGQETLYETCACVIHNSCIIILLYETLHNRPFSVTSEESLRDSEPSDIFTRAPRDRILHEV